MIRRCRESVDVAERYGGDRPSRRAPRPSPESAGPPAGGPPRRARRALAGGDYGRTRTRNDVDPSVDADGQEAPPGPPGEARPAGRAWAHVPGSRRRCAGPPRRCTGPGTSAARRSCRAAAVSRSPRPPGPASWRPPSRWRPGEPRGCGRPDDRGPARLGNWVSTPLVLRVAVEAVAHQAEHAEADGDQHHHDRDQATAQRHGPPRGSRRV